MDLPLRPATLVVALALAWTAPARAHELRCEKTVDGKAIVELKQYPATLHYRWTVFNIAPDPSVVLSLTDSVLSPQNTLPSPVTIPVGGSISGEATLAIASFAACEEIATWSPQYGAPVVENVISAGWDLGEAQCRARVVCRPETPPPPVTGATRTMGFFKTHLDAAQACLDGGQIDLGFVQVDALAEFLGLLWGSPAAFDTGVARGELDRARFLLGRQTLVAICNQRLFGTSSAGLVESALAALTGTSCTAIQALIASVDAFNNSGDANPFPAGLDPGPATPAAAAALADDPTSATGHTCQ